MKFKHKKYNGLFNKNNIKIKRANMKQASQMSSY